MKSSYGLPVSYDGLTTSRSVAESGEGIASCYVSSAVTYAGDQNLLLEASPQKASGVYRIAGVPVDSIETRIAKSYPWKISDIPMVGRYRRLSLNARRSIDDARS
jgi:hypothetical protein